MKVEGIDDIIKKNNLDSSTEQVVQSKNLRYQKLRPLNWNLELTNENPVLLIDLRKDKNFETNHYWGEEFNTQIQKHHNNGDYIIKKKLSKSERKRPVINTSFNNEKSINKVNTEKIVDPIANFASN